MPRVRSPVADELGGASVGCLGRNASTAPIRADRVEADGALGDALHIGCCAQLGTIASPPKINSQNGVYIYKYIQIYIYICGRDLWGSFRS